MQRKNFKKEGNYLAFNTPQADPIFLILQETDAGFMYIMESSPFGPVQFVHRNFVLEEETNEDTETVSEKKQK